MVVLELVIAVVLVIAIVILIVLVAVLVIVVVIILVIVIVLVIVIARALVWTDTGRRTDVVASFSDDRRSKNANFIMRNTLIFDRKSNCKGEGPCKPIPAIE